MRKREIIRGRAKKVKREEEEEGEGEEWLDEMRNKRRRKR